MSARELRALARSKQSDILTTESKKSDNMSPTSPKKKYKIRKDQ